MSPNFGVPPWKRALSRVVFYLTFVGLLTLFDAEGTGRSDEIDFSTWTNEELGAGEPVWGERVE